MVLETSTLPTELHPYVPKYYIICWGKCQAFFGNFFELVEFSSCFMGEGAKISHKGEILLLPNRLRGRSRFEAHMRVPTSAEVGKGFALDPQTFEKV